MTVLYPTTLPQFPQIGYTEEYEDNLIRNEVGVGPSKTRPRSTAPRKKISFTITLTQSQKSTLEDFFKTSLAYGSLEFQHHLPDDATTNAIYKFQSPLQFKMLSPSAWSVTMKLEITRTL